MIINLIYKPLLVKINSFIKVLIIIKFNNFIYIIKLIDKDLD